MVWSWLPEYLPAFIEGIWLTLQLLGLSIFFGMILAIPIGLAQAVGRGIWLGLPARSVQLFAAPRC